MVELEIGLNLSSNFPGACLACDHQLLFLQHHSVRLWFTIIELWTRNYRMNHEERIELNTANGIGVFYHISGSINDCNSLISVFIV